MTTLRRLTSDLRDLVGRALVPFRPAPGTTEGAVMLGLVLIAAAFVVAGLLPLALGIPGACLVMIGLGFSLRRGR